VVSDERRCLVIDCQPMVRLGVRRLLDDRYEVEETDSWEDALQLITDVGDFDVAIVDMQASAHSGRGSVSRVATIKALLEAQPGMGVVAHGQRPERHLATEAMAAGANAYVAKSSPVEELRHAIDAAAEGEKFVDPAALPRGRRGRLSLTRRQRQILQLIADGHTTAQAARRLGLGSETVKTHTKQMLARLEARDRAQAVAIGLRNSLID
jgi:DNA-binding NarL/FixJ family response regulator